MGNAMANVERPPAVPLREQAGSRSKKLDMARLEGVKKFKEYIIYEITPTLPGWQNLEKPEGLLSPEFSPLVLAQRSQIVKKMISPIKRRLGLPAYEPVWHATVRDEMERWMRDDLQLSPKQLRQGMKLVDKQMNKAVSLQKGPLTQRVRESVQERRKRRPPKVLPQEILAS